MGDGRAVRRGDAAASAGVNVDEKAVAGALYEPADVEPDLVLILGPADRLPPSLVWELAYGELVFLPVGARRAGDGAPRRGGRRLSTAAAAASAGSTTT